MVDVITTFARNSRKNQTDAEKLIWSKLRNKQLSGIKFRRQQTIGNYIVDFVSLERMLVIELDRSQHMTEINIEKDKERLEYLINLGYSVLRFWNNDVFQSMDSVLEQIHPTLTLSSEEREQF